MSRNKFPTRAKNRNETEPDPTQKNDRTREIINARAKRRESYHDADGVEHEKNPGGNPGKYKIEYAKLAYRLISFHGFTQRQLADALDVREETIISWKQKHKMFAKAVKRGRDLFDSETVEKSVLNRALGYDFVEVRTEEETVSFEFNGTPEQLAELKSTFPENATFKLDRKTGRTNVHMPGMKVVQTNKHIPGDPKSQQFWLTNRSQARWQTTHAIRVEGDINFDGTMEHSIKDDMDDGDAAAIYHELLQGRTTTPITGKS